MSDLTIGRIEELNRNHGNVRLKLSSVNGYVIVADVLKELADARATIEKQAKEIETSTLAVAFARAWYAYKLRPPFKPDHVPLEQWYSECSSEHKAYREAEDAWLNVIRPAGGD